MSAPRLAPKGRVRRDRQTGRAMLLYPERGLALSDSAAAVLQLCDGARTVDAIVTALVATSGADEAVVRRDVCAFLGELGRRGLLMAWP